MRPVKVVLLHNMVAPYRLPLFNALAGDARWDLSVLLMALTERRRQWTVPAGFDFRYEVLRGVHLHHGRQQEPFHVNPSVVGAIRRLDPDAVVFGGWSSATSFLALLAARRGRKRRLVIWSESNGLGKPSAEGWRAIPKRWLARSMDDALVPGRLAEEYLRRFARPDLRFHVFPNVVDPRIFRLSADERARRSAGARERIGARGLTFLFSGRLSRVKGLDLLLEAYGRASLRGETTLLILGAGELEAEVRLAAGKIGGAKRIVVLPFRQLEELPDVYAVSDVLVLPSREDPWPLVVVEAMTSGIPAAVSAAVGNGPDLVRPGETGWIFPAGDAAALQRVLEEAPSLDLESAGRRAQEHVGEYCALGRCIESFAKAVGVG